MFDFLSQWATSLADTFTNPQKRVFLGYLLSAWFMAMIWLVLRSRLSLHQATKQIFSKDIWWSDSARADYLLIVINRFIMLALSPSLLSQLAIATLLFESLHGWFSPDSGSGWPVWSIGILFTATVFTLDDASRYLVHRWMHSSAILWRFHRVHHTATSLTPLTIFRTHPVEGVLFSLRSAVVQGVCIGLFVFFFGNKVDLITVLGANAFIFGFNVFGANLRHSHIALHYPRLLEQWLMSPAQHHIHHSIEPRHYNTNYGVVLSIWDRMGRSLHHSEPDAALRFGVHDHAEEAEHHLKTLYWQPFIDSFTKLKSDTKTRFAKALRESTNA